jgi:lipid-A-disaccharide synthase-like uncharacterized protein
LDNDMHNILKRTNLSDQNKWTLCEQVLQKYLIGAQTAQFLLRENIPIPLWDVSLAEGLIMMLNHSKQPQEVIILKTCKLYHLKTK